MKKIVILIFISCFLYGCHDINKGSYEEIINFSLKNEAYKLKNHTSEGYSYYLPKGLKIKEDNKTNLVIQKDKNYYYLYLDLISYHNKIKEEYKIQDDSFYSQTIKNGDKFGYSEINLKEKNKYLIEIMYNYAKIEVIVEKRDINEALSYSMALLSSVAYNDVIIENLIGENILNYNELEFNIFETVKNSSNLIEFDGNNTHETTEEIPDTDLINKRWKNGII